MRATRRLAGAADVPEAARLLREGGLVAFPTETVYGLGALALDPLAARSIYAAKGRPATNPLIVHLLSALEARALVTAWPEIAQRLADRFWPGPLTLVLPRASLVPDEVTAGGTTVALRAPRHPLARALLAEVGAPLAAPSANRSEHVSPTTAAHVLKDLDGRIDAVLDGGPCDLGIESTVLSLAPGGPRLLRAGSIGLADLEAICGPIVLGPAPGAVIAASPGLQARHYAPAGIVRLAAGADVALACSALRPSRVGALLHQAAAPAGVVTARLPAEPAGYARGLYSALRDLEDQACDAIVVEAVPQGAAWDAIRDRLQRAAGSSVLDPAARPG